MSCTSGLRASGIESDVECVQVILDERDMLKTKLQEGGAMGLAQQIEVWG